VLAALILMVVAGDPGAAASGTPTELWVHDALTRALAASEDITDPFRRTQTVAEIAEAQSAAGDSTAARASLERAAGLVKNIDEDALRSWALHDIGLAYVKADDLDAAETTAESIRDTALHDVVLAAVVDGRRGARDVEGALTTARRMRDVARQGQTLRTIAMLQSAEGHFSDALVTARSIQHPLANALALGDIAAAMARDNNPTEALLLVGRIRDSQARSRGFAEIAAGQATIGDYRGAVATAAQADDKLARAEALARIASVRVGTAPEEAHEMFTQSLALATGGRASASRRCSTLVEIARAQLAAGDHVGFTSTLERVFAELPAVKGEAMKLDLLTRIAPLQARAGDYAAAFSTAMRVEDGSLRPLLVRDVATSQAEKGDIAGAVAAARKLDDRPAAAAALFGILRVQSEAHDAAGMRETLGVTLQAVRVIGSAELRAGALGSLAAARALEGDFEAAQAMFTEAMNTAAAMDQGQQQAAVYARIADALADRHRSFVD
jgi:tetratricopeptide (TPR) repeat protein